MYRKVIENPYIRISIRRLKSKKRAKILGSRFAEAVPPAESLKDVLATLFAVRCVRKFRSYGAGALLSNDLWGTSGPPGFSFAELDRTETELDRAETEFDRADSVPKLQNVISKLHL